MLQASFLENTKQELACIKECGAYFYRQITFLQIERKPVYHRTSNTKTPWAKTVKEDGLVNGVKGNREVKQYQSS